VAREVDEIRLGRSALAVPVRDRRGGLIGFLVAIGRTGRIRVDGGRLTELLRDYAAPAPAHPAPAPASRGSQHTESGLSAH
jgi:DNA-binding IclR family transcriptional regulator